MWKMECRCGPLRCPSIVVLALARLAMQYWDMHTFKARSLVNDVRFARATLVETDIEANQNLLFLARSLLRHAARVSCAPQFLPSFLPAAELAAAEASAGLLAI